MEIQRSQEGRFYKSLLPWKREVSRLDLLDTLMRSLKFRLDRIFGPAR